MVCWPGRRPTVLSGESIPIPTDKRSFTLTGGTMNQTTTTIPPHGFPYPGEDYLAFDTLAGGEWNDIPGAPHTYSGFYVEFGETVIPEPSSLIV